MRDKPSSTARLIAAAAVLLSHDPRAASLVSPGAARLASGMLARRRSDRVLRWLVGTRVGRWAAYAIERLVLPGILRHFALRKQWIERRWREARAEGFSQLLVLAAGLDTLGVRIAAEEAGDGVRVVEVDHPASQRAKLHALEGEPSVERVRFVPAELGEPGIGEKLVREGLLDAARPTFVVIEGLMMYLPRERVESLLSEVSAMGVPRVRVAWTFIETEALRSRWHARGGVVLKWWLALAGEPFASTLRRDEVGPLLRACGLRLMAMDEPHELAGMVGTPTARGPVGDWVVLAERAENETR